MALETGKDWPEKSVATEGCFSHITLKFQSRQKVKNRITRFEIRLTFLVISDERLGKGLTDGIDLSDTSTTLDANPDVDVGKAVLAEQEDRLQKLVLESLGLNLEYNKADDA